MLCLLLKKWIWQYEVADLVISRAGALPLVKLR